MADRIGEQLGNYRLTALLGEGGFAQVYLGEHIYLKTLAAIKVLYARLAQNDLEVFLSEARIIANLEHPNIVRVLEFGVQDNTPYLVMQFAPNGTLRRRHPAGAPVLPDIILPYVKQTAAALQYAHDQRLVHRDVKPENLLLGRNNEVLLSDFGIAVVAQSSLQNNPQSLGGTVAYMAPEQLQQQPRPASDQYSLGIVIYEWLSGARPFNGTYLEIASKHVLAPPPPLREKAPALSPEIESVVMTALSKDPQRRFGSLRAFANAFEQACVSSSGRTLIAPPAPPWQADPAATLPSPPQPVDPPPGPPLRASTPVAAATLATRPAVIAPPGETPKHPRLYSRRSFLLTLAGAAAVGAGIAVLELAHPFASGPTLGAPLANTPAATLTPGGSPTAIPVGTTLYIYGGHPSQVWAARWSPDGTRIASGGADRTVQVWDALTGQHVLTYRGHQDTVTDLNWSPDVMYIASAGSDNDQTAQVWEAATGTLVYTYHGHAGGAVEGIAWSPDGQRVASSGADGTVQVWHPTTGELILTYKGHKSQVTTVAWSPDGQYVASGGGGIQATNSDHTVQVWDASSGQLMTTYTGHNDVIMGIAWAPDGMRIVSGSVDDTAQVWNVVTGGQIFIYRGHTNYVFSVSWSLDGTRIASASNDKTVQVWDAPSGGHPFIYRGHNRPVWTVRWSPDSKLRLVSAGAGGDVRVWQGEKE